jgi:hypothetical protein
MSENEAILHPPTPHSIKNYQKARPFVELEITTPNV